jgi:signal peptidase I
MIYASRRRLGRLPRPLRLIIEWAVTIGAAVLIVLAIKEWVVNPYRVPSASMEPTLRCARPAAGCEAGSSDRVFANRFIYRFRDPHRGEIVVFDAPPSACGTGGTFVKRLMGLPGDRLREQNGFWFVNGKRLEESYVEASRRDRASGFYTVPQGRYFFMGDNRNASCDSRTWGAVPRSSLIGPVFATYWPITRVSVNAPGLVGASILAGLAVFGLAAASLLRRRRRRET